MSANILGQRFTAREKPGWHRIGRTFDVDDHVTVKDAILEVGGDLEFTSAPLYYLDHATGKSKRVESTKIILRKPTVDDDRTREIGVTGGNWDLRQYRDYAEALSSMSEEYPLETAGVLGMGEHLFFSLRGPEFGVDGPGGFKDEVKNYFIGEFWQKPGNSHRFMHSPVRAECENTLSMAARAANINVAIPHVGDPTATMKFIAFIASRFQDHITRTKEVFDAMAHRSITPDEFAQIVARTFPRPPVPRRVQMLRDMDPTTRSAMLADVKQSILLDRYVSDEEAYVVRTERVDRLRATMRKLAQDFNADHPKVANTVWMAYNAATELADWRESREKNPDESVLFGARAKEKIRAYTACASLVK